MGELGRQDVDLCFLSHLITNITDEQNETVMGEFFFFFFEGLGLSLPYVQNAKWSNDCINYQPKRESQRGDDKFIGRPLRL